MFGSDQTPGVDGSIAFNLSAHFLIAMPGMEDETFSKTVVYLCEHSEQGALGIVINKPTELTLPSLFAKVDLPLTRPDLQDAPVFGGGPLHTERGFVLHEKQIAMPMEPEAKEPPSSLYSSSLSISDGLEMTTSRDVLEALSHGSGPRKVLVSLGHAGWGRGQLESELAENAWLHVKASPEIIFDTPIDERYSKALDLLGLKEWMISRDVGRA